MSFLRPPLLPLLLLTLLCGSALAQEPEPFRGDDEIEGRDFEYTDTSFLHRFSYRFRPEELARWNETREGFRTTTGSVRSDEFWVFGELRKTIELRDPFHFLFRFKRDEDFDSRYDRTLVGGGVRFLDEWSATVLGDVVAEKGDIDLYLELAWADGEGNRFRTDLVFVDMVNNDKGDEGEYDVQPFTWFAEGWWEGPGGLDLGGWVNLNPHLRFELPEDGFDFTYDQYAAGLAASYRLAEDWSLFATFRGELGERDRRGLDPGFVDEQRLSRRNLDVNVEVHHDLSERVHLWLGARYFRLSERDRQPNNPTEDMRTERREKMIHTGVVWRLSERFVFWPGLYFDFLDNTERFPQNPVEDEKDDGFVGKLTFPLEIWLTDTATVTINPTAFLHQLAFGGGNVQILIPF